MGVLSVDDRTLIMAVFSSSGIDYSQVMWVGAVVHIERSVVSDGYWRFSFHLADGLILEGDYWGTAIQDVRVGRS